MFKKLEKTECDGLQSVTIFFDTRLKTPYILAENNAGAEVISVLKTPEDVFNKIKIHELKQKFSVEEIANAKNYVATEEKSNAEIFKKYGIVAQGGKRANAGRKTGSTQKTPKTNKTEYLGLALTQEEKEFLKQQLLKFRNNQN